MAAGIIKALFGLGKMKTVPWTKLTPELHNQLSSQLGKLMFVVKSQNLKLTKFQQDYLMNQLKHMEEFEKRVLTKTETPKPKGEVRPFMGFTPKVVPKDKTLLKDSPEAIAKIKAENKAAAERLKAKKKTPPEDLASGGIAGPLHLYDGGRANYDKGGMSRRGFLKMIGGLSALPFVGKYFKAAKTAAPAAEAAVETIKRTAGGIPEYAYNLIEVVKNKGIMEIMEGVYKRNPVQKKYTYKGVEVTEDGLGTTSVRKQHEGIGYDEAGEGFEGINKEVGFEIRTGEDIVKQGGVGDDAGKVIKADDEYFEATVRPDAEGKMKDVIEGIDDADHLDLKRIADESLIKKAEGGRVDLSKGGLAKILGV